eukprot:s2776_g12.t1
MLCHAWVLLKQRRLQEAEDLLRETMHRVCMDRPALLLIALGRLDDAEQLLQKTLDRAKQTRGENDSFTLECTVDIAELFSKQHRPLEEVEKLIQDALDRARLTVGENHFLIPRCMRAFATLYEQQGRLKDAERFLRDALSWMKRVLGDEHTFVCLIKLRLGSVLYGQGKYEESPACVFGLMHLLESHHWAAFPEGGLRRRRL